MLLRLQATKQTKHCLQCLEGISSAEHPDSKLQRKLGAVQAAWTCACSCSFKVGRSIFSEAYIAANVLRVRSHLRMYSEGSDM